MRFKETSFELILSNNRKVILLFVSGFLLLTFTCNQLSEGLVYLIGLSEKERRTWLVVLVVVGGYGLYRLLKRVGAESTQITVCADRLLVLHRKTGAAQEVVFDRIAAYRFTDFNNDVNLRLKLTDGSKMTFQVNELLHGGQNLAGLVQAFEAALSQHAASASETEAAIVTVREKTLFEKPISTVLLVLFTGFMAWVTWQQHAQHRPVSSSVFSLWGIYSAYLVAWLFGRERRNEK